MENVFDIMLDDLGLKDLNIRLAGHERCAPSHSFGPALRDLYLIHYIFSGKGTFKRGDNVYSLSKGDMFIIHPLESTFYQADGKDPWHYCWLGFNTSITHPSLSKDVINAPECEHIFQSVREYAQNPRGAPELYLTGKIYELLALLSTESPLSPPDSYVHKALNYINAHYSNPISISQLAKNLGLERSYFSTSFRRLTQKSPQRYILDFRLDVAADLLSAQGCSVTEAALSSGFLDMPYFSRQFKRRFGLTPAKYLSENTHKDK